MSTRDYLQGKSTDGYEFFGPHIKDKGYIFRVLAPEAEEVFLIGDFNDWKKTPMRRYKTGVFSLTDNKAKVGDRYQYLIKTDKEEVKKIDPFARSIIYEDDSSEIIDDTYKFKNKKTNKVPKNILQVHLGSLFKQDKDSRNIFEELIKYAKDFNYTTIYLMPINEYQNYKSMGYAPLSLFSYSKRYGSIKDFKDFVDKAHKNNIGVIAEIDISEFDGDKKGLIKFDGSDIYNYQYDDILYNNYGSVNFDISEDMAKSYVKSAIGMYLDAYKLDGISFPDIDNVIYWQGESSRGINNKWCDFLKELIELIKDKKSLALASFNGYSGDIDLDFDMIFDNRSKTLVNLISDLPINRENYKHHIYNILESSTSENILGFSFADSTTNEASLAMKIYSDDKKAKQEKGLLTFLYTQKSPKILFMGDDRGDLKTFSIYEAFDPNNIENSLEDVEAYYKDLSHLYLSTKALNDRESSIELLDIEGYSLSAYKRAYKNEEYLVVINFTDIDYQINSPYNLEEVLNIDDLKYHGSGNVNGKVSKGEEINIEAFGAGIFKIL